MAEAGAQFGCALHRLQAFRMQFGTAMVLQHHSDPELARRTGDRFEEGALVWRRGIGITGLRSGSAIEHEGRVAHTAADYVSPADRPPHPSPASGAIDTRPRDGLSPNRPHCSAGIRSQPPPSVACATGKMPAETAAAAPPEEPPGEYSRFQGLWQEP